MKYDFQLSEFLNKFSSDDICLEEIKKLRFPNGVHCDICKTKTKHYRVKKRTAYSCEICRHHVYPLSGTIFEKSSTPLRIWFYALFLMTQTRAEISIRQLQQELGVTYKTAWRIYKKLYDLMQQNDGDLLRKAEELVHRWTFFNKIHITVVEKDEKVKGEN